jgi:uncharacterized protein
MMNNIRSNHIKDIFFYILAAIYLFNDFIFIYTGTIAQYLFFDYLFRIISIALIVYLLKIKIISLSYLKLNLLSYKAFFFWSLYLIFIGLIIFFVLEEILLTIVPKINLFTYPKYDDSVSKIIDLTFGLIIVAVTEELIFRGYWYSYLKEKINNDIKIIIISSVVFGLIHWSIGIVPVFTTAVWGVFAVVSVMRTNSIYPALFAHYIIDLISFSEIIPKLNF